MYQCILCVLTACLWLLLPIAPDRLLAADPAPAQASQSKAVPAGAPAKGKPESSKKEKVAESKTAPAGPKTDASDADEKKEKEDKDPFSSGTFSGLKFRNLGPAWCSGRISDFAVNPANPSEYYVAVGSGHIWKTVNAGTTWSPVFDNHGSYAIGCLAMDPGNPFVVWAGTGENTHQRALGWGDGVYRTTDGGKSWKNMGLKESRQIGMIAVDPRDSRVVYVAAEGSVWGPGGERGLYKTVDGGQNWEKVLHVSDHTGVNNVVLDPRNPDVIYATSEQRRRHAHTKIGGGPETAFYKSADAGKSWHKLTSGLPSAHMGGIGLALAPANPDVLYAIIEAADDQSGFYRSTDRGASWAKMSDHASSGQYFNEIVCDPKDVDRIYSLEVVSQVTADGGKTWRPIGNKNRHVDDHALWVDPGHTAHLRVGGDGGIYETYDAGATWQFIPNLPITQFYRVAVDDEKPFYNVYGGTQDNNSMGGPSRTLDGGGVTNADWFVTQGGDGFWTAIDPTDPNIVYAEAQYAVMVRYDRKSQEAIAIRPAPRPGELSYRWNWDTPLFISPHAPKRLYCAANKVFRSDDRGDTWQVISEDLTANLDRNTWPVMDKFWSVDAVAKDLSTSLYGTIVALDESPLRENLLYAGTDDGLVQVTEDARTWRKAGLFPGVPEHTYVSDVLASRHDDQTVFAAFNNHLRDDFKPYLLKSTDRGATWVSIAGNLPERGPVWTIQQDPVKPDLLFAGTEFGLFFSVDGGGKWIQLKAGLPVIPVRDIAIQKRENDLVLATFGRGFYILDDYSPLRQADEKLLQQEAVLFPVKDALMYIQPSGRHSQGTNLYAAENPPFGAVFTFYLKEAPKTRRQARQEKEKDLFKEGKPIPQPSEAELRAEAAEEKPHLVLTITDEAGQVVQRLTQACAKGIHRLTWNLRLPPTAPMNSRDRFDPLAEAGGGRPAMPGTYQATLAMTVDGQNRPLAGPVTFNAVVLANATLPAPNRAELAAFQRQTGEMVRSIQGAEHLAEELLRKSETIRQALSRTPAAPPELLERARKLSMELRDILFVFKGKEAKASEEENPPAPVPLNGRLDELAYAHWRSTSGVTGTQRMLFDILKSEFPPLLERIRRAHQTELPALEKELESLGAPWTPGRMPEWKF